MIDLRHQIVRPSPSYGRRKWYQTMLIGGGGSHDGGFVQAPGGASPPSPRDPRCSTTPYFVATSGHSCSAAIHFATITPTWNGSSYVSQTAADGLQLLRITGDWTVEANYDWPGLDCTDSADFALQPDGCDHVSTGGMDFCIGTPNGYGQGCNDYPTNYQWPDLDMTMAVTVTLLDSDFDPNWQDTGGAGPGGTGLSFSLSPGTIMSVGDRDVLDGGWFASGTFVIDVPSPDTTYYGVQVSATFTGSDTFGFEDGAGIMESASYVQYAYRRGDPDKDPTYNGINPYTGGGPLG